MITFDPNEKENEQYYKIVTLDYEYNPDDAEMREDITFESSYKEFDGSEI